MLTRSNMVRTVLWICNLKRLGYDYEILTFLRRRSPFGYIESPLQDLCYSLQMGGKEILFRLSFSFPCGSDRFPLRVCFVCCLFIIIIFAFFFCLYLLLFPSIHTQ